MIKTVVGELRTVAERCSRFARESRRHVELSAALEEVAIDLMAKASDLEHRFEA